MASSRKSTSSKSYQEGPRKKPLRQKDHVEPQPTVEHETSSQKRRFTPKSNVVSKSKTTADSSKAAKVDSSKGKVTKKKMTTEERERSDKKPFSKEHTPPDIQSPSPPPSSSATGAEKPGVSSSANNSNIGAGKSSESSVSNSSTASTKSLPADNANTSSNSGTSLKKSSSSVSKGATMKKSRTGQSDSKKDSSRERKMGVGSGGHGSKSEQKSTSKTKTAKVTPSDSTTTSTTTTTTTITTTTTTTTSNLSSTVPVSNTPDAKVPVIKKSSNTEPKIEPPKPHSGLLTGSSNDSNNTSSLEHNFFSHDPPSNGRLKRSIMQEQAFDECEEDSICTSDLSTSSSFSLSAAEIKKYAQPRDSSERRKSAPPKSESTSFLKPESPISPLKFEPTSSVKPESPVSPPILESPVSSTQLSQSELQKQKREQHLRELQLADPSLSVKVNLQKKMNLQDSSSSNSVCKETVASNNLLCHPPIIRHSSSPAKVESYFPYRRSKDHLALVEVLRKFGLSHCVRFFSHDMTLAKFMTLTSDDILETYQVTNPLTRKQLQHVITQLKAEEDTDNEVSN